MQYNNLTTLEKQELQEALQAFGLKTKEQTIYLSLLNTGSTTITPLARKTGLPVTTVQSIMPKLQKTGIINTTKRKSRHVYTASEPKVFKEILKRQLYEIGEVIPLIKKLQKDENSNAKIEVYYRERVTDIFHEALKSKEKIIYEIISAKEFQNLIGEKFHFSRRRIKNKINLKSLRIEAEEIKKYSKKTHLRELREAKFLPREMDFKSSIMFWDNTVAFFSTKSEGLAWTVTSPIIKEMMLQFFEMFWSVGRRMETK
jgi:sugar-specific transcriptional regulator TrmB